MFQETFKDGLNGVRNLGTDDVLAALGLRRRATMGDVVLPAVGIFAAGVLVGGAVALLLTPKSGTEMRRDLKGRADDLRRRVGSAAKDAMDDVHETLEDKEHLLASKIKSVTAGLENGRTEMPRPSTSK